MVAGAIGITVSRGLGIATTAGGTVNGGGTKTDQFAD
jgi:hypothetical protein